MNEMMNDKWIGIEEAAEYLGVKPITVRDWIKKDTGIPAHKIGKKWKFKSSELDSVYTFGMLYFQTVSVFTCL